MNIEFVECAACQAKSGTPLLCQACYHNREVISFLRADNERIAADYTKHVNDTKTSEEAIIERLQAEVARLTAALNNKPDPQYVDAGDPCAFAWMKQCRAAEQQGERLRAAIAPFAAVAALIPDHWPGRCRLREDAELRRHFRYFAGERLRYDQLLNYWPEIDGGRLPTIAQWREAAEAAKESD